MVRRSLMFAVMAALVVLGCGGDGGDGTPPTVYPYTQADLAGSWHVSILQAGPSVTVSEPGWMRGWAMIDAAGHVAVTSLDTNWGPVPPSVLPWGMVWTIDPSTGIISETTVTGSSFGNPDFHGKLASHKNLAVGTATVQDAAAQPLVQVRIMQKLSSSVTYSLADIAEKTFVVHQVESGAGSGWMHAAGTTDAGGTVTIPVFTYPTGTVPGATIGTLSIHPGTGIVTMSTNTWFLGKMSADKSVIIGTETDAADSGIFRLTVIQMTEPSMTYAQADLAGTWSIHGVLSAGAWLYGTASIGASGSGSFSSWNDSMGGTAPPPFTTNISAAGVLSDPTDTSLHGQLAAGKDVLVTTQTISGAGGLLSIGVK